MNKLQLAQLHDAIGKTARVKGDHVVFQCACCGRKDTWAEGVIVDAINLFDTPCPCGTHAKTISQSK